MKRKSHQPNSTALDVVLNDDQDSAWKEMLDEFFPAFLAFFFPEIHRQVDWARRYVAMDKELKRIWPDAPGGTLYADKLFKV